MTRRPGAATIRQAREWSELTMTTTFSYEKAFPLLKLKESGMVNS